MLVVGEKEQTQAHHPSTQKTRRRFRFNEFGKFY